MVTSPLGEIAPFDVDSRRMSVLLVDDDEALVDMSSAFLAREIERIETTRLLTREPSSRRSNAGATTAS